MRESLIFHTSFIVLAVCCVGPLALPLIWWRPQTTRAWKIGLTIGILVFSWLLLETTLKSMFAAYECDVENYKYFDAGYTGLIAVLQNEIDTAGPYKAFLEGYIDDPPTITVMQCITDNLLL